VFLSEVGTTMLARLMERLRAKLARRTDEEQAVVTMVPEPPPRPSRPAGPPPPPPPASFRGAPPLEVDEFLALARSRSAAAPPPPPPPGRSGRAPLSSRLGAKG
jgi:hypothetical protein